MILNEVKQDDCNLNKVSKGKKRKHKTTATLWRKMDRDGKRKKTNNDQCKQNTIIQEDFTNVDSKDVIENKRKYQKMKYHLNKMHSQYTNNSDCREKKKNASKSKYDVNQDQIRENEKKKSTFAIKNTE